MGSLKSWIPRWYYSRKRKWIVSQIVRSPGAYISCTKDKTGKNIYGADIIPARGTWLEFESELKNTLSVRIDKQRKVSAVVLLRALGLTADFDIYDLFGTSEILKNTIEHSPETDSKGDKRIALKEAIMEVYSKLRPGEPVSMANAQIFIHQRFFDHKKYDLGPAGRFKLSKKLGIYNRLNNVTLAEDLISADEEIRFEAGHTLSREDVISLQNEHFFEKGAHTRAFDVNVDLDTHNLFNIVKVYTDDSKTKETNIIGTDLNLDVPFVTASDILACFSYFLNIMDGIGLTDDIDVYKKKDVINRICRRRSGNYANRYKELYKCFKENFHVDLEARCEGYNLKQVKQKDKLSVIKYAELFGYIDDLYSCCTKLFEAEIDEVLDQINTIHSK